MRTQRNEDPEWLAQNRLYRLNNHYHIIDKRGQVVLFAMNWAQKLFCMQMHSRNIILKSRQIGFSTLIDILLLDQCLWTPNTSAGIVADTEENARLLFRRVQFAYDKLPSICKVANYAKQKNAQEYTFQNGSHLRVATSMRSSTLNLLHVSEFGKICERYPERAREIITGSFEAVPVDGFIFVESTAEGSSGYFHDMCIASEKKSVSNSKLTQLDFKFHFYPWWQHPEYQLKDLVPVSNKLEEYFTTLVAREIWLTPEQKSWYAKKFETLGDDMRREYCSTSDEVWLATNVGYYYSEQMASLYKEKRVTEVPYDPSAPVDTFWDLGFKDPTCILFAQRTGDSIRFIDYFDSSGENAAYYVRELQKRPYVYGRHFAPHDINVHEMGTGLTRWEQFAKLGLKFEIVTKLAEQEGIGALRDMLPRVWIDKDRCDFVVRSLKQFQKAWNPRLRKFQDTPLDDWSAHASDACRYCAVTYMQQKAPDTSDFFTGLANRRRPLHV